MILTSNASFDPIDIEDMPTEGDNVVVVQNDRYQIYEVDPALLGNLTHNTYYYLHVCSVDFVNNTACSPSYYFLLDRTPPVCDHIVDLDYVGAPRISNALGGPYFASRGGIGGEWGCYDPESGIKTSQLMMYRKAVDDPDENSFPLLPRAVLHDGKGRVSVVFRHMAVVNLQHGARYFGCATALNRAESWGNYTAVGPCSVTSHGATFDLTAPKFRGRLVDNQGRLFVRPSIVPELVFGTFVEDVSVIHDVTWELVLDNEAEERVAWSQVYLVGTKTTDVLGKTLTASVMDDAILEHGKAYYSRLTARNPVDLRVQRMGRTFYVDGTPPNVGSASLRLVLPSDPGPKFPHEAVNVDARLVLTGYFGDKESGLAFTTVQALPTNRPPSVIRTELPLDPRNAHP